MSIFEAQRLKRIYEESVKTAGQEHKVPRQQASTKKPDKSYGWIPNPKTPMNHFYNNVCKSLFDEMLPYGLGGSKSNFKKIFHSEAKREYNMKKRIEKEEKKIKALQSVKDPSQPGYLLQQNRVPKPHDRKTIQLNLTKIDVILSSLRSIETELKQDLASAIHSSGRIKTGKKTAHSYNEETLTTVSQYIEELNHIHAQLVDLVKTNADMFKAHFTAPNRLSRMKKQNRHKASKRKELRKKNRMKEMLKCIAPSLKGDEICSIKEIDKEVVLKLKGKRKIEWLLNLTKPDCHFLDSGAKVELKRLVKGKQKKNPNKDERSYDIDESVDDETDDEKKEEEDESSDDSDGDGTESDDDPSDNDSDVTMTHIDDNSSDSDDYVGPYWETSSCRPFFEPLSE